MTISMHKSQFSLIAICIAAIICSCAKVNHLSDVQTRNYRIEKASFPVDTKIATIIEPFKNQLDKTMNEVIGINDEEMVKGKPNSKLTNWFADVLLMETQKLVSDSIDFALQNYGGIRIPALSKGNITVGKVYELMPFDNIIYVQEIKGDKIQLLFDKIAESGGWPISHTIKMDIGYGKATNIKIKNQALDTTKTYMVAIPDYLANGGDNLTFLKNNKTNNTGKFIRDLIITHLRRTYAKGEHIKADNSIRIKD
ncbi:MAG: 5'-nucleotidase C-terminal domain-containing protein [Saprospiraceae bacterium]|nr:5'-nucleotidase C-terminal domain-containing protein [Saprospiraceae bacterium]